MSDEPEQIIDAQGYARRPGSLVMPAGMVSSFPPYVGEGERPLWTDAEIKSVISDPNRRNMVDLFPFDRYGTNQRNKSSCNGFAAASAITRVRKLRGIDDGWVGSGAYIYAKINRGRDAGSVLEDGLNAIQTHGVCSQDLVPWDQIYTHQQPPNANAEAAKHTGLQAYRAETKQGWMSGLAAGYVGIAAVMVGPKFDVIKNGVAGVQDGMGNHAVLIEDVVWRNGEFQFVMCNSWGAGYADKGRVYLTWQHFAQPFGSHVFYLLPSSSEN